MIRLVKEIDVDEGDLSGAINIFHYYEEGTYTASVGGRTGRKTFRRMVEVREWKILNYSKTVKA